MEKTTYKALEALKHKTQRMLEEQQNQSDALYRASSTWSPNIQVMKYVHDLSPENLALLRLHSINITGMWPLEDFARGNLSDRARKPKEELASVKKYQQLTRDIPATYHYNEPISHDVIKNIGVDVDGKLVPRDALAYQVTLTNLYNLGVFDYLKQSNERKKVLEIGAGYGALVHQIGHLLDNKDTYFIVDLPDILFWSAAYLTVNNGSENVYVYDPEAYCAEELPDIAANHKFVLLPNWRTHDIGLDAPLDLAINMISFPEMQTNQVKDYCQFIEKSVNGFIYSDNQSVYARNDQLNTSVESILAKHFKLFPDENFYDQQELEWNIRRIYLGDLRKNPETPISGQIQGYSYTTDGTRFERVDDIFRKIKLA